LTSPPTPADGRTSIARSGPCGDPPPTRGLVSFSPAGVLVRVVRFSLAVGTRAATSLRALARLVLLVDLVGVDIVVGVLVLISRTVSDLFLHPTAQRRDPLGGGGDSRGLGGIE
jgi:hypothetical protein